MSDELPEGWARARIGDVFDCWGGMTPSTAEAKFWGGSMPWISSKDVKGPVVAGGTECVTERALAENRLRKCPVGSVLVVVRSGVLVHTLPVAVTSREVVVNQDVKALDSGNAEVNAWAALYLRATQRQILEANRKDGTTVQSIRMPELLDHEFAVAPLAEQRRIVAKVEALLEQVRRAKDRLDRVPLILKRFRQAVLAAACEGRLTEQWRERAMAPKWTNESLADLLAEPLSNGRSVPDGDGFPVLRLTALRGGKVDISQRKLGAWTAKEASRFRVCLGDFLVARGNGSLSLVGRGGLVEVEPDPVAFPDTAIRVRPNRAKMSAQFLRIAWDAPVVRMQIEAAAHTTAGIHKVSQGDLEAVELPVPSPDEQAEIVRCVDGLFALATVIEQRVERAAARAGSLPQAILYKAFAGELVPTEAELARAEGRDYETAEQLLARVRDAGQASKAVHPSAGQQGSRRSSRAAVASQGRDL